MKITVTFNGKPLTTCSGLVLSEIIKGEKPCGGHGKCGKCKVVAKGALSPVSDLEREHLAEDELLRGVRLACLTTALGDCEVSDFAGEEKAQIVTEGALADFEIAPSFPNYGVAIDIGTTTVAAQLFDREGNQLSKTACLNPQSKWGADVISRIEAALGGKSRELAECIRGELDKIIAELSEKAGIDGKLVDEVVITGNTVMLCLLTEQSVEPLSHAPFEAERLFGEILSASELSFSSIKPETPVYLPPCFAAFVGADTSCAVIASGLCDGKSAILADIGTNGEMALWDGSSLSLCSTAAGPAFEGVGISMGMRGSEGAVDKVSVVNGGLFAHVIGEGEPKGICGSGLVDAVSCLLDIEELDETGFLEDDTCIISGSVELTQNDIRMVQLAKSAICAGLATLMELSGISTSDIDVAYIAGGFGTYLNMANAEKIGLLPSGISPKTRAIGNAALGGAAMLLLAPRLREKCEKLTQNANVIELSTNKIFSDKYIEGMLF